MPHTDLLTYDKLIPTTNISLERNVGKSRLDFIVAAIIADLSGGHHIDLHTKSLKAYGAAATAGLLPGLTDPKLHAVTFYALPHCWDPSALEPFAALLADPDLNTRQMAAIVIGKNAGLAELARLSKTLLDHQRPEIAGPAYEHLEAVEPDLVRTEKNNYATIALDEYFQIFAPILFRLINKTHSADAGRRQPPRGTPGNCVIDQPE